MDFTRARKGVPGWSLVLPTPTPTDGSRQITRGPYVPPALRNDNGDRRANGRTGKQVAPLAAKRVAPASNLPNLTESRKTRTSPITAISSPAKSESASAAQVTDSAAFQQIGLPCGDCDPSGGGGGGGGDPYFGTARLRPINSTGAAGVTLGSQNFNWSLPLLSLPGRAGLDLSMSLFYNSLVWTKQGSAIQYNADHGTPAPGFQLGLPRLQAQFVDSDAGTNAYLMVTPSGGRVEMRQVGSTSVYESAEGSYTQLTFSGTTPVVRTTDGTQFIFETQAGAEWRCTKIEDRNGNYISATYDATTGHIATITDTLGRVVNFTYYSDGNLDTIAQTWGSVTHSWAKFVYKSITMSYSFSGLSVTGASNVGSQTVIDFVVFAENTSYHFDYNGFGQVYQIRHKAPDGHELEHTFYNIENPGTQTDCPRFTERHDYAQDWNGGNEAITRYAVTTGATWTNPETTATETGTLVQQTAPDGSTIYKEYSHASGWDTGLTRLSEFFDGTVKKKWISISWTQDNTALSYPQNPRVAETSIYDDGGNRRRSTIDYGQGYNLPTTIGEYSGSNGLTLLRSTAMSYVSDSTYLDRRIIGLPLERDVYDANGNIVAKQDYQYDWGDSYFSSAQPSTNFDATNYSSSFRLGRANLTAIRRYDCTNSTTAADASLAVYTQRIGYNLAGSTVFTQDTSGHTTSIDYTDNFSDSNKNQNTLAYPKTVTDADGYSSRAQYNYDFGAITLTDVPTSGVGASITYLDVLRDYDEFGRIKQIKNQRNNAYTRFVYEPDGNFVHTYQTLTGLTQADEFHSWQVFDGAGRVRETASDHPGSANGDFSGSYVIYDNMGRVIEQSNPTEINSSWVPSGDDAAGWHTTQQTYDWKGRPLQTTNADGTTRIMSYGGCGCAGGEVTTVQDEHGRQRRYRKDSLGRLATVEEMVWNTGSVYSTTTYGYNARDQILDINQNGQQPHRTFHYDGHGRLDTRTTPEQGATTYSYSADDTTSIVTDARNVTTTYGYNNRHQITSLTYNVTGDPTGQTIATANASFGYDAAGNRTSMSDGLGSASYVFNNLSQMTSETRNFNGLTPSYTLNYEFNLAGELKSVTNQWNAQVSYGYDKAGRLSNVGGAGYAGVTNYASSLSYRAFGAIKGMSYGDGHSLSTAYDNRLRPTTWNVSGVLGYNYNYDGWHHENTGRVVYAQNIASGGSATNGAADSTLDRSYEYDLAGRLAISHSGAEARAHVLNGQWGTMDGPYSQGYDYDVWGNVTHKYGWGGEVMGDNSTHTPPEQWPTYSGNRRTDNGFVYDAAGNVRNDGTQTYSYDATGQQTYASGLSSGWGSAPTYHDNPIQVGVTTVQALHITELRTAINSLRSHLGASAYSWTTSATTNDYINASPIIETRTALDQILGAPSGGYALGLASGQPIKAIHIQELRDRVTAAWNLYSSSMSQHYDGDTLRVKKTQNGYSTYYVRSSVLGGQVIAELDTTGNWSRGYVYAGGSLMAVQQGGVFWSYEDPITKSKRMCDVNGNIVSLVELDPWGADTTRSSYSAFQPHKFTSYERDANGSDEAMFRRYNRKNSRFDQPDPYEGSSNLADPQSLNRYAYTENDPVNFVDPSGLMGDFPEAYWGFDHFANGFWGSGYLGGNGWGSDPHPGRDIIRTAEPRFVIATFTHMEDLINLVMERSMFDDGDYILDVYKNHGKDLTRCINSVFRTAANNLQYQQMRNAPTVDRSKTMAELGQMGRSQGRLAFGATKPDAAQTNTIYLGSDIASSFTVTSGAFTARQITGRKYVHELGNYLSLKLSGNRDEYGDGRGILGLAGQPRGFPDYDTGAKLESCVFSEGHPAS